MAGDASAKAVRAAAAAWVLADGRQAELSALSPAGGGQLTAALQGQLCDGDRAARLRALSAILTSIALDLSDWGLR